ncbi:MAG TPA: hypothetical protein VFZ49_03960 [Pyrinomonadaceae bacterium]
MLGRTIYLAVILTTLAFGASAKSPAIQILIEPTGTTYQVAVTFDGDADGTTNIRLPDEWGGQGDLYKAIRNLSVSKGASLSDTDKPLIKTVTHSPSEKITITYELAQDFQGPLKNEVRYRPVTDANYIHWIGTTVWVLPEWDDQEEVSISLEWKGFPKHWTVANSFGAGKVKQRMTAKLDEFGSAIFVAGDFRLVKRKLGSNAVNVAVRGDWQFKDAELAEIVGKVLTVERDFFNDHSQKYYLVTLVPVEEGPNAISLGGTGLTNSFALFATTNSKLERFPWLLGHEYAHNWIPGKLGKMPDPEQNLYWFSEGFTEFYTYRLLHRGGLLTDAEFVAAYNDIIREYYMSPVRGEPNDRIITEFWTKNDVRRLPYLRGLMFATNLGAQIKHSSGGKASIDDVILELYATAKIKKEPLSFESLAAAFAKHLGVDAMPDIKRHIIDGEPIVPQPDALGSIATQEIAKFPVFELGFDFERFGKDRVAVDVDPNSSAYAAGLRNGQRRNGGASFSWGDTTKEIELKVKDDKGEKTIRFLPVARKRLEIPQYRLVK